MAQKELSGLEKIRAELICSLCLDILTEPKKLDCDHSFCQKCLQEYLQKSAQPTDSSPVQPDTAGSEQQPAASLVCPFCQKKTTLPQDGILGLRLNFKLKSLVDSILSEEQREKTVRALGKGHEIKCHKQCTQHREDCIFFCEDCKELVCRKCLSGCHRQHSWSNYDEILPKFKKELRGCIQPAYEAAVSAQSAVQQLDEKNSAVTQNQESVKENVEEYFHQLVATLEKRKEKLLGMVNRYTECKLDLIKRHSSDLQRGHTSLLQHLERIERQMEEDDVSLLTGIDDIKQKISLHCDTIRQALSSSQGVDSFIELREEESLPLQLDRLGRLILCQRDSHSDVVSVTQEFVDTGDMEQIQLDLARPADGMKIPEYMQFRQPETENIYEEMVPQGNLTTATNELPPNTSQPSLPLTPVSQEVEVNMELLPPRPSLPRPPAPLLPSLNEASEGQVRFVEESMEQLPPCARRDRPPAPLPPTPVEDENEEREGEEEEEEPYSEASDSEDPYDTIPAQEGMMHQHFHQPTLSRPRLVSIPSTRREFVKPIQVIDLQNDNVLPSGIACTNLYGHLYITDTNNMCLHMLDKGDIFYTIGGTNQTKFKKPVAISLSETHAYILEQGEPTAVFHKFALDGHFVFTSPKSSRRKGPQKPWGIATSKDDKVYVSDWKKRQIYVYNSDDGKKIRSIKGCKRLRGRKEEFVVFQQPAGIAIDRGGRLMLADRGEKCVWCINTDGDELIRKIGEDHLQNPYGIGVAKDGRVVVTESESDCVSVFGENGELLQYFGGSGSSEGQFCRPHHVFVDESNRVFIADKENRRIQIFQLPYYVRETVL